MKWFFFAGGIIVLLFFLRAPDKKINAKVLFINQVRGEECCQKGSYEFTKQQLELFKKNSIPATFILRYDAFNNNQFISLFKSYTNDLFDYGIFFEITPNLAKDAGVVYKGSQERWYRAQYAYLVGYSQGERKKIIDTAMMRFKKQFGFYPKITGGWMIDTFSAEYLSSHYGVLYHEITREQWGTDGYALYGGSILSAYTPSKKWVFMPAVSKSDALPLYILRQTVSDPVRNYGDLTSGYTSQPNDYSRTKGFDYFKHLLGQVEGYSQPIAILGLENSLDKKYQDIYQKQVEYVSKVVAKKNIILPKEITKIKASNYITGTDYDNKSYKAFWIETPKYRARIIQKNNYVYLTDLRVFDSSMQDPYYATPSGEKTAFWEIPFVFDSSQNGIHAVINTLSYKFGIFLQFLGNYDWLGEQTNPVANEKFIQEMNGINFPKSRMGTVPTIKEKDGIINLKYTRENGKSVTFIFYEHYFLVKGVRNDEYEIKGSIGKDTILSQEEKKDGVQFTPQFIQKQSSKDFVPANSKQEVFTRPAIVKISYNAPLSLIGRNPSRLVVVSKDAEGKPALIKNIQIRHTNGNFDSVKIVETEGHLGEFEGRYIIDIEHKTAGTYIPILTFDSQQKVLHPISFVIDCKKNIKTCLFAPQNIINYAKVKWEDILNRR